MCGASSQIEAISRALWDETECDRSERGRKIGKNQEVFELMDFCSTKRGEVEPWRKVSVGHGLT